MPTHCDFVDCDPRPVREDVSVKIKIAGTEAWGQLIEIDEDGMFIVKLGSIVAARWEVLDWVIW